MYSSKERFRGIVVNFKIKVAQRPENYRHFRTLLDRMCSRHFLTLPDPSRPFSTFLDSSRLLFTLLDTSWPFMTVIDRYRPFSSVLIRSRPFFRNFSPLLLAPSPRPFSSPLLAPYCPFSPLLAPFWPFSTLLDPSRPFSTLLPLFKPL